MATLCRRSDERMLQVTIWMNMPSFYQDGAFNALAECGDVDLRVLFARETTLDRLQLGWKEQARKYPHRILSYKLKLWDAVRLAWSERRRFHIVNGIWAEPSFAVALCVLAVARSRFVIYAEAPDPRQVQTRMRAFLRGSFGGWVAKRALGFLAVSHFAEQFYTHLGFAREHVYPFGYFQTYNDRTESPGRLAAGERTEVIFVGQLISRKGVDLLLEAMRPLFAEHPNLVLSVIGDGSETQALQDRARFLGIAERVNFEGTVSSDRIRARLASAAVLVLPSRWDGWGMVVNEALSAGVPVIVSDRCGAADLVQHGVNGYVFRSEDIEDLRQCLRSFLENADARSAMRSAAASTGRAVSAEAAAPYLVECLKHMTGASAARPAPPWAQISAPQSASR
jgi:glycosyltransferase involved in cell wall biosynthesis